MQNQSDYIKQLEEDNESLKKKLDDAISQLDGMKSVYNDRNALRKRISELAEEELKRDGVEGVATKYKIFNDNLDNMSHKEIAKIVGISPEEFDKFMNIYAKGQFDD